MARSAVAGSTMGRVKGPPRLGGGGGGGGDDHDRHEKDRATAHGSLFWGAATRKPVPPAMLGPTACPVKRRRPAERPGAITSPRAFVWWSGRRGVLSES